MNEWIYTLLGEHASAQSDNALLPSVGHLHPYVGSAGCQ